MALLARRADDLACPAALTAGAPHGEETLLVYDFAAPMASRARGGAGAGLGGFAAAMLARLGARHLDLGGHAENRLFELNLEIVADILAALRPGAPPRAARRAEQIAEAEKVTQNVAEVEIVGVEALRRALHALMPVAVVCRALLGVAQNAICLGRLFEFFLGGMIARIHVRVAFPRQLAVGALDLLIVCVPAYPQDFVVVSFRHGHGSEVRRAGRPL